MHAALNQKSKLLEYGGGSNKTFLNYKTDEIFYSDPHSKFHVLGSSAQNRSLKLDGLSRTKTAQAIEDLKLLMAF